ncbi:MAG: hypothetical protein C0402_06525 [Thermodesulfovibrio sp.]|nr:hypothetical protein [Thermodesulfovibrio sp.]
MRQKIKLGNQGFIKGFFMLALLVGIAYTAIMFGAPYFRYNTLRSHTKDILAVETPNPDRIPAIKAKILEEAVTLKVPLSAGNLDMTINTSKVMIVKARWSEVVNLMDYYSKKVDFEMDVEY